MDPNVMNGRTVFGCAGNARPAIHPAHADGERRICPDRHPIDNVESDRRFVDGYLRLRYAWHRDAKGQQRDSCPYRFMVNPLWKVIESGR